MRVHGVWRVLRIILFVLVAATVFSFAVMWLWNWLMPVLFGLHAISFWQALGILVLSKILFGGFRGGHGFGRDWRMRLVRRMEELTPEEQEKFRAALRGRCGPFGSAPAEPKP